MSGITDVTTGQTFATISDAIADSNSGDVINIPAGTYVENFPKITHSLTLQGVGGLASLMTPGQPLNGEAILVQDAPSVTLNDIELSGATVPDNNGAGFRMETGTTLTIDNSWILGNQDGLLVGAIPGADITIENSEFNNNGDETGFTHNVYVGVIDSLTIENSYFHDALGGHEIKSRANTTIIENNRIQDGPNADSSFSIDLPNGGLDTVTGNVIEKGPKSPTENIIHYGGEISPVGPSSLEVSNNVVIDDRPGGAPDFVLNQSVDGSGNPIVPDISTNTFYGVSASQLSNLPFTGSGNQFPSGSEPTLNTAHPFVFECFLEGTHILTRDGPRLVEELEIGHELVVVHPATGGITEDTKPITWIGKRTIHNTYRHPYPEKVHPVRVYPNAFGPGLPSKSLFLSPEHAIYWNGALIPVGLLVNGSTIRRMQFTKVVYYHIELAEHRVIIAENLPVESYLDVGNKSDFDGRRVVTMHPNFRMDMRREAAGCAPLIVTGQIVNDLRQFLAPCVERRHAVS